MLLMVGGIPKNCSGAGCVADSGEMTGNHGGLAASLMVFVWGCGKESQQASLIC